MVFVRRLGPLEVHGERRHEMRVRPLKSHTVAQIKVIFGQFDAGVQVENGFHAPSPQAVPSAYPG